MSRGDRALSALAAATVAAAIGLTVGLRLAAPDGPPRFDVRIADGGDGRALVAVRNDGGASATQVIVEVERADGSTAEQTIDWLTPAETVEVVVLLEPGEPLPTAAVTSFTPPG